MWHLCNLDIFDSANSLLSKETSYVPSPKDINWYDFDSFVNKLTKHSQSQFITTKYKNENHLKQSVDRSGPPPPMAKEKLDNFKARLVSNHSLENFIKMLETDIFRPNNYQKTRNNLSTEEKKLQSEFFK